MQVLDECQAALGWLEEKENLQSSMKKTEDPVLVTADIKKKEETLTRVADPILNKPAPKPKVSQQSSTAFTNFHVSQQSGANFASQLWESLDCSWFAPSINVQPLVSD